MLTANHNSRTEVESRPAPQSSHVRWHILLLLGVIAALTYLDRLNLSIAGKHIQDEFAFSTETMGWILSAFVLGYALFQVPGGWLGDRLGPRGVLTAAMIFWSAMTAATALAPRLPLVQWFGVAWSFAVVRFLVGMGEATVFPNISRMTAFWMSARERGLASSLWLVGIGAGGMVTPLLVGRISERWGWRASFYVCAAIGVVIGSGFLVAGLFFTPALHNSAGLCGGAESLKGLEEAEEAVAEPTVGI